MIKTTIAQRLQALSDYQQAVLGKQLGLNDQQPEVQDRKRLAAFILTAPGAGVAADELRAFAQERLPDYMVPALFVPVENIPYLPNGKVDRQVLMDMEWEMMTDEPAAAELVEPRTPAEKHIAAIWTAVLGIKLISVHDKFFELGGDSLLAIQVVIRFNEDFQQDLTVRAFFENPTIAGLVDYLQEQGAADDSLTGDDREEFFI